MRGHSWGVVIGRKEANKRKVGENCISGSSHIDHRSETVEEKSVVHIIPSIWGSGRTGTRFPRIAAFPRWSKMPLPSLPQRWETAPASSCPVCLAFAFELLLFVSVYLALGR